ncbi:leukocyte receptor cluster member 9 [Oryzias melastigma]|uniref:Leukocyte receptor cluster member 9 n=1 Tax=Oryzias melastigma TaxID=30732 RepID=A0A3B3DD12_ORYME|nr:leukocyte receptor cluster member 9 [Oryzias melastigma]
MASGGTGTPTDSPEGQVDGGGTLTEPNNPNVGTPADKPTQDDDSADLKSNGVKVCQFFQIGKCRFGHKCRSFHSEPPLQVSAAAMSPEVDDKENEQKMAKIKKKKEPNPKNSKEIEVTKKPRMRTADDVISRILWDPSVDASEFIVGYVDRFLGVLERPFCDFNWDANPCDCDYTTELALPRHRIQYFIYRGQRVWDRHSRSDRVFGSTGQSLAPPFGREEEVNAEESQEQPQDDLEAEQEEPTTASGQDERKMEDGDHTKSTDVDEENTSRAEQECPEICAVNDAPIGLQASKEQQSIKQEEDEETILEEWEESWDGKEDNQSYPGAFHLNKDTPAPLVQREEKRGVRPPKKRPTHFICFRANTPAVLSCFQQLREELVALMPCSAPHWHAASKLHVTLCLLNLYSPAEVESAKEVLRHFARLDRNPPVAVTFPVKLKHFNGRVLYLSPQPHLHLQQLNGGLQEAYREKGWLHRDSYNPRYHLTLAKFQDVERERIFEGVGDLKVGKGLNFGRLPVNTLHLCAMSSSEADGFYDTLCTVTLR